MSFKSGFREYLQNIKETTSAGDVASVDTSLFSVKRNFDYLSSFNKQYDKKHLKPISQCDVIEGTMRTYFVEDLENEDRWFRKRFVSKEQAENYIKHAVPNISEEAMNSLITWEQTR